MISSIHEEVEGSPLSSETIPSATSLDEAGIKLIPRESRSGLLNIKFDKGVLEIPPLLITDTTETAFRNLISFEQCYPKCKARITSYAIFVDRLINSAKDAELLGEREIIKNWLSPDDTARFFNQLYLNTHVNENYYQSLSRDLNILLQTEVATMACWACAQLFQHSMGYSFNNCRCHPTNPHYCTNLVHRNLVLQPSKLVI